MPLSKLRPQVRYKFWAAIGHDGQTLDDLVAKMEELGNQVIEIDHENQRILVAHREETGQDLWGCTMCLREGEVVIVDQEKELKDHYLNVHGREI